MNDKDPFDSDFSLPEGLIREQRVGVPRKIQKQRQHFIPVPMRWYEILDGAPGQTYRVALYLLYLNWKDDGKPIKLPNGMMGIDGVPSESKRRALRDLERRELITVEWRPRKSPIVKITAP